jgi:L-ascorbate metabolism protein UlaG (beta-lactamase superfamily)
MKQIVLLSFVSFISLNYIFAQRSVPDPINTSKGPLLIQPILHTSLVLTWNEKTIYVDPYGGSKAYADISNPDLIIITDIHGDHMNIETLTALNTERSVIIAPQAVVEQLPEKLKIRAKSLGNGGILEESEVKITALPMYNLPETEDSRHPKGRGNGYILTFGNTTVYISGDTEDIPEMRSLKNIDIAFVCMNQPFTMTIEQAASAVLEFKPKIVYPFHYRGQGGFSDVETFRKLIESGNNQIEVRLRNWYPTY